MGSSTYAFLSKRQQNDYVVTDLDRYRNFNNSLSSVDDISADYRGDRDPIVTQISDFTSRNSPLPETDFASNIYRPSPHHFANTHGGNQLMRTRFFSGSAPLHEEEEFLAAGPSEDNYFYFGRLKIPKDHRVCILTDSPTGYRQEDVVTRKTERVRVSLCVWFVKIEEIDTQKEQFSADAIIKAKWREPSLDSVPLDQEINWDEYWDPKLYVMNTLGEPQQSKSKIRIFSQSGRSFVYEVRRIRGVFLENLELEDFPFDIQDLTITVGSERPDTEVEIIDDVDDPHTVSTQFFVDAQEWYLYRYVHSETEILEKKTCWGSEEKTWTVRLVKCRAARRPGYFIWNVFGLTFLICVLVFVSFAVDRMKPENRLLLNFTLLLTSVAAKSGLSKDLPKISYTTYSDRYMIGGMAFLTMTCLWHGLINILPLPLQSDKRNAEHIFLLTLAIVFVLFNIGYALCVYLFPYKRRREMSVNEESYSAWLLKHKKKQTFYTTGTSS